MRQTRLILVVFFLSACGHDMLLDTSIFDSYVQTFQRESVLNERPTEVKDLVIKFSADLEDTIVGRCHTYLNASPLILININWWERLTSEQKEILLFHEIGHCILGLSHSAGKTAIMNKNLLSGWGGQRSELLSEYFKNSIDSHAAMRYSVNREVGYASDGCRN